MVKKYLSLFVFLITSLSVLIFLPVSKTIFAANNGLVISQIKIAGVTATDEFVEIYNPTNDPIDITGYKLTKKVSSGTQSTLVASMSGVVSPKHYFLIKHPTGYTGTIQPEMEYSTTSSITADNVVILYSDNGVNIVDKVGFGSSFDSETLPFAANPQINQSIRRINNVDTNNNSLDFELLDPASPRNSTVITEPQNTETPTPTSTPTSIPTPTPETTPTPQATSTPQETPTPTTQQTAAPQPTFLPTLTPSSAPSAQPTSVAEKPKHKKDKVFNLSFGVKCKLVKQEFVFHNKSIKYFKLHFSRR